MANLPHFLNQFSYEPKVLIEALEKYTYEQFHAHEQTWL
jgi:hypothetical protein